jgi:hypothetical protein
MVIQGNYIGTDITGRVALPNLGDGVSVSGFRNTVEGNLIAFNGGAGVTIMHSDSQCAILANSIHANGGLGIDLIPDIDPDGITPNDPCDADLGSNGLQNYPVITSVTSFRGKTTIEGTLNSTPNTSFTVQFFSNSGCDASGFGEGEKFIGSTTVTTNGNCNATFKVTLPVGVLPGQFMTSTATDPNSSTSEFSQCSVVLTLQQATQLIINDVARLVAQGVLNKGNGNALTAKLQAAIQQMNRGNFQTATNQLRAFINQVNAFIQARKLSQAQGQALINAAQNIILQITS